MKYVKKSIDGRELHKREYDSRVNERQMQTKKGKVDTSKALDASLVITKSSGTEFEKHNTNSRSGNDADADYVDIKPIYDEEPMTKVQLTAEDVGTVPVWVKHHGVLVMTFREDGLSAINTKIGTPLMLDSYMSDMYMQSWGRSSYARAMIELRANVELKDNIVAAMPKITREGYYTCNIRVEYEWKSPRCACCKVFGNVQEECPKNIGTGEMKNLKKTSQTPKESAKEVSKSNPFEVLTSIENDMELGTNGGTTNLANQVTNSSGSSFWNVDASSLSTTPIVEKIYKIENLIIEGKVTLIDDEGKPLEKVASSCEYDSEDEVASVDNEMANFLSKKDGYGTQSLLERWTESYENADYEYDPYDDDMYEGQDIPDKLQAICDKLDIIVRGRRKK
ncbi:hypothetical protein Tco_1500928 [Tanacetum coccineum]